MLKDQFVWETKDGLLIYGKHWAVENPKAVICLVHGLGEHVHRYDYFASYYNDKGFTVIGYDRRGHGQSDGKRGHCDYYGQYLEEVDQLLKTAQQHYPTTPHFLYGHSMGGNVVLNYLIQYQPTTIRATVVTGSLIQISAPPPKIIIFLGRLLAKIAPTLSRSNSIDGQGISSDPEQVKAYETDPLVHATITYKGAAELLDATYFLDQYSGQLATPLLAMHAGNDPITKPEGTIEFTRRIVSPTTLKIWDGLKHEIHQEPIKEEIYDYTIAWLEQYLIDVEQVLN